MISITEIVLIVAGFAAIILGYLLPAGKELDEEDKMLMEREIRELVRREVEDQKETIAAEVAEETKLAIMEYEAYKWLFRYWYSHSADLDIEYDAAYNNGTKTVEKVKSFAERHPETHLKYVSEYDLLGMTEEDRKLYAEIAYSWLTDRIDQIKNVHDVDYLFVVMTEEPYDEQFFVLSGAYPGAVRGTDYEEVYTLGVTSTVGQSQQKAMENAIKNRNHLADAGNYLDFYSLLQRYLPL